MTIYTVEEINTIRTACKISLEALTLASSDIQPGVTTQQLNDVVHDYILKQEE